MTDLAHGQAHGNNDEPEDDGHDGGDHHHEVSLSSDPAPPMGPIMLAAERPPQALRRRARILAGATIGWNVIEAVVAISAGIAAGSVALVGFGIDSTIEVSASVSVL